MNRTNICKNIVQSIKDYITDQVKLEPHRVEKHFVRRRKLSLLQVIIYLRHIITSQSNAAKNVEASVSVCYHMHCGMQMTVS